MTWDEFEDLVTQVRRSFASYNRSTYHAVVVYDFLMPLTRENKLRKALDDLFYRDTLERRIREVGLVSLAKTIPRGLGDGDEEYVNRVIEFIDGRIGGFSISHVSGRFRTGAILSRQQAAEQVARDEAYLIDETTAVVRFIIPCLSSKIPHGADFDLKEPEEARAQEIATEVQQIRTVFFELFVEALVPTIRGEKLIWMVETTPTGQRLYELDLVKPPHGARTKVSDDIGRPLPPCAKPAAGPLEGRRPELATSTGILGGPLLALFVCRISRTHQEDSGSRPKSDWRIFLVDWPGAGFTCCCPTPTCPKYAGSTQALRRSPDRRGKGGPIDQLEGVSARLGVRDPGHWAGRSEPQPASAS